MLLGNNYKCDFHNVNMWRNSINNDTIFWNIVWNLNISVRKSYRWVKTKLKT